MTKLVINDTHVGVSRVAGATPATAAALRKRILNNLRVLLLAHPDKDIIVNGDLFDAFDIPMGDALELYHAVCEWILASGGQKLIVFGQGNHDISKDSSRLSMFAFITALLHSQHPKNVAVITKAAMIFQSHYMIPHCTNQEIFNLELEAATALVGPHYIYIHANYDNKFATEQDHSLNVSIEQAKKLTDKGHILIFGHEHQQREPYQGIVIVGNQWPTSVSDCLGNTYKRAIVIEDSLRASIDHLSEIETWSKVGSFTQVDWRTINGEDMFGDFVRVTGNATAEEAASVIQVVSKLRQKSQAFVVTNAVKIEGIQDMGDIEVSAEEMRAFDVLSFLYDQLDEDQAAVVRKLVSESEVKDA
jgi:metallophosphoesterase superfamily enzyme